MAIAVRSMSTNTSNSATGSFTVAMPTGVVSGDYMIAFAATYSTAFTNVTATEFTQTGADSSTANSARLSRVFSRTAGGSEPANYTFQKQASSAITNAVIILAFTGVDTASPFDAAVAWANGAASNNIVAPSVSPIGSAAFLLCGFVARNTTGTYTMPGSMTEEADIAFGSPMGMASEQLVTSGATGTRTGVTSTAGVAGWNAFSLALKSAAVTPPTSSFMPFFL